MARGRSVLTQRTMWTVLVGLVAAAFWIVALGVGLRAWLTHGPRPGLVGHVTAFGRAASPYMISASVLTMTAAMMGIGTALVRHLVDGPVEVREPLPKKEPLPEKEPLPAKEPLPERPAEGADRAGDDGAGDDGTDTTEDGPVAAAAEDDDTDDPDDDGATRADATRGGSDT